MNQKVQIGNDDWCEATRNFRFCRFCWQNIFAFSWPFDEMKSRSRNRHHQTQLMCRLKGSKGKCSGL